MTKKLEDGKSAGQRYEDEREFHNHAFSDNTRVAAAKYYSVIESSLQFYKDQLLCACAGREALEYGCGPCGDSAFLLAEHGAIVTGIDISDVAISQADAAAKAKGLPVTFLRMNAEETTFANSRFGLICGTGILHHLDLKKSYRELARILSPEGGCAVFSEPLGHNPFINLYRKITPSMRTEDEHPLLMPDLRMAQAYFGKVEVRSFHLLSLVAVPFRNRTVFKSLVQIMERFDQLLFRIVPWLGRYAWVVIIIMSDPKPATKIDAADLELAA